MKVIHILNELKFSGAEIMYVDAASIFQAKGCELTVMATANRLGEFAPYFEKAGYQLEHYPMPPLKNYFKRIKYYFSIIKFLKKEKYDVVHIHSSAARWGFSFCARVANIKAVYTFHNVFSSRFFTYPYHYLLRWSAKNIFNCQFHSISDSVYNNEIGFYKNKTAKIYNWYGNTRYYPAADGEKKFLREKLGISEHTLVLISVGGCSPVKRHVDIINAMPLILKSIPDCLYIHLGEGCSENEEIKLANDLGIDDRILFCGNQPDVRKYLIASDIYLMPSRFEGIPITTIEAMACKITAILYDVPGLRDFNKDGENSMLIPQNYLSLAQAVIKIDSNKIDAIEMAERAKLSVYELYSMTKNATAIYDLYIS